jgi:hypothetical protein
LSASLPPVALTQGFADDPGKQTQWIASINRTRLGSSSLDLASVVVQRRIFLEPILEAAKEPTKADRSSCRCG